MSSSDELISACARIEKSDPETWSMDLQDNDGTNEMVHHHFQMEVRACRDLMSVYFLGMCIFDSETGLPWDDDDEDYVDIEDHLRIERKKVLDTLMKFCIRMGGVA